MDAVRDVLGQLGTRLVAGEPQLVAELADLRREVLPLADAQEVEELGPAALAELVRRELAAPRAHVLPQVHPGQEVRARVGEPGVRGVGLVGLVGRPLPGVLGGEARRDDGDLVQAAELVGLEHHAPDAGVDGQARQPASGLRQPGRVAVDQRPELGQQPDAVAHREPLGRVDERELLDRPELRAGHLQDHRREVRALDLRVGELRARVEVVLGVEPDADAVRDAPAPPGALGGRRLRDRLDRQPLHLGPPRVPRDAREARVDDVADARDGQRGLGDVRREHDPSSAARRRLEDAVLLGGRQARVEGEDVEVLGGMLAQGVGGVADLPLAGEEDEHVARRTFPAQLVDRVDDAVDLVALVATGIVRVHQRPVPDLDGVGAPGDLDDRGVAEVAREPLRVDRRRGDDDLEVGAAREQLGEVAEQEVDVEAALVGLVDDQRVVPAQHPVLLDLGEQDAVGHELDQRVLARAAGEADLVADGVGAGGAELLGDAFGHRARRDPPRLGVADRAEHAAAQLERHLRQLRGLARPGLAGDDDHLVGLEGRADVVDAPADRQLVGVGDGGHRRAAAFEARLGGGDVAADGRQRVLAALVVVDPAGALEAAPQPVGVRGTEGGDARGEVAADVGLPVGRGGHGGTPPAGGGDAGTRRPCPHCQRAGPRRCSRPFWSRNETMITLFE